MTGPVLKTLPELTVAGTPSTTDLLPIYQGASPLKKVTATVLGSYFLSTFLGFLQTGTGAVARTIQSRLRDSVHVTDFGTIGTADDSAVFQLALNTGKSVIVPQGSYLVNNLQSTANNQQLIGLGWVILQKNANGPILTASGADFTASNIAFYGDAASPTFTGDNIVLTGARPTLLNCGSQWAYARAVYATGNRVRILGCISTYQTADAGASAYDIEIGTSGTATLYHQLRNITSGQSTGGIKFIDTGSHMLSDSQFGKLLIDAGTSPSGSNGGMTVSCRITGNAVIELPNATFSSNQFSANVTFEAGTSSCSLDVSNLLDAGSVITNNGNVNNYIVRNISTGSTTDIRFGPDSSLATLNANPNTGAFTLSGNVRVPKGTGLQIQSHTDTYGAKYLTGSDVNGNMSLINTDGSNIYGTAGAHQFFVDGVQKFAINDVGRPQFDGGTQTTVGSAGAGSALPATPTGYVIINIGGTEYVMPYYAKA